MITTRYAFELQLGNGIASWRFNNRTEPMVVQRLALLRRNPPTAEDLATMSVADDADQEGRTADASEIRTQLSPRPWGPPDEITVKWIRMRGAPRFEYLRDVVGCREIPAHLLHAGLVGDLRIPFVVGWELELAFVGPLCELSGLLFCDVSTDLALLDIVDPDGSLRRRITF